MVALSAISSATQSIQSGLGRAKLAQAQREANQAEDTAKQLRAEADDAEQRSRLSQDKLGQAKSSSQLQNSTYSAPSPFTKSEVPLKMQNFIENLYRSTSQKRSDSGNALKTNANSAPVINAQGQATGRILNLSA